MVCFAGINLDPAVIGLISDYVLLFINLAPRILSVVVPEGDVDRAGVFGSKGMSDGMQADLDRSMTRTDFRKRS